MADNINCQKWIARKVKDYDRMLQDATLTPRLEERLEQARDIFSSALALQDTNMLSITRSLKKLDTEIEDIYRTTFGSISRSAELLLHLTAVRGFVRALLYDDYGQNPAHSVRRIVNVYDYVITGKIIQGDRGRAQVAREYGRPEVDDARVTETMKQRLRDCCREMLLDVDALTFDFVDFASRSGKRRDRVRELVERCRWTELAAKLEKDRLDLARIVPRKDRIGKYNTHSWHEEIFDRIQEIEETYFDSIQRPCRPNSRAKRMSDKRRRQREDKKRGEQRVIAYRRTQSVNDIDALERELPPVPYPASRRDLDELRRGVSGNGVVPPRGEKGVGDSRTSTMLRRHTKEDLLLDAHAHGGDSSGEKDTEKRARDEDVYSTRGPSPDAPPRYSVAPDTRPATPTDKNRKDRGLRAKERRSLPGLVSRLFMRNSQQTEKREKGANDAEDGRF